MIRPSFILGGRGTGIAHNREELVRLATAGLAASPVNQILVEASIAGWKEYELEVMRDRADNCVVVCSIENFDPMGSIPATRSPSRRPRHCPTSNTRKCATTPSPASAESGGDRRLEHPVRRQSCQRRARGDRDESARLSLLCARSKATGFPIAKIAARLAVGYLLDEIPNDITKATPASFEPSIDYVVTKIRVGPSKSSPAPGAPRDDHAKRGRGDGYRAHVP